ncbi:ABC transporter substrate-binding protein [Streptomyces sp. NPDC050658]|uniref:ABC transporter substrate-binding protein n=1 Tax=unclassified Streptomyces TaxID=2593676 RepID=UPI00343D0B11
MKSHRPLSRRPLSRRGLLASGGAIGLTALLAACGDEKKSAKKDSGSKTWRFKDDRGRTAEVDHTPKNIVAYISTAAALHDYGVECTGVFGPSKPVNGKPNPQAGELDVDKLTSLGESFNQFNIEKYAALKPDLLISNMFPPPLLWFLPEDSTKKIEALAPTVGIKGARVSLLEPLKRYTELAESLGGDLQAEKVRAAKSRFDKAERRLRKAAKDNPGLKVLAMTGDAEQFYVAVPDSYCDLNYFKDLGIEFVEGKKVDKWGFWEFLSWENADKYHADLIMIDNRESAMPAKELAKKPTWELLPAVKAGQTVPWSMEERYSYAGFAPVLEQLAAAIEKSKRLKS